MHLQLESCIISQKKVANANIDIDNSDIPFERKLAFLQKLQKMEQMHDRKCLFMITINNFTDIILHRYKYKCVLQFWLDFICALGLSLRWSMATLWLSEQCPWLSVR